MMKRFVRGADRHQTTLLPELIGLRRATLDVDVFVDALERRDLGFDGGDLGGGPTLDYADAAAFLAIFEPMIDAALKRRIN
jgi:hypothetical protein